jgi:hypothetical protein
MQRVPTVVDDDFSPDRGQNDLAIALGRKSWLFLGSDKLAAQRCC